MTRAERDVRSLRSAPTAGALVLLVVILILNGPGRSISAGHVAELRLGESAAKMHDARAGRQLWSLDHGSSSRRDLAEVPFETGDEFVLVKVAGNCDQGRSIACRGGSFR